MKRQRIGRRPQSRTGATVVEFAAVAPIIFSVFLGSVELANLNFLRNMANDAAFQVARAAIVPGADANDIGADAVDNLAAMGIEDVSIVTSEVAGNLISVAVTIPVDPNSWGFAKLAIGESIVQTCELARQISPGS